MTEPNWSKIIDDMLATEQAKKWTEGEDRFGVDEQYFSEHSKNLDIIDQFEWVEEFFKEHSELKAYLDDSLRAWWEDQIHDDPEVFWGWFLGDKIRISVHDGYVEDLVKILSKEYRKRITEVHKCSDCGAEISEVYPYGHEKHLHRIGEKIEDADKWKNTLLCEKCFEARLGR